MIIVKMIVIIVYIGESESNSFNKSKSNSFDESESNVYWCFDGASERKGGPLNWT